MSRDIIDCASVDTTGTTRDVIIDMDMPGLNSSRPAAGVGPPPLE
jgi:hypothetical protein